MPDAPLAHPLLKLGRLELDPALRAFQPGPAVSDLVVTATVEVPDSASERQQAWDVAWADAGREAIELGAGRRTAEALAAAPEMRPLTAPGWWSRRRGWSCSRGGCHLARPRTRCGQGHCPI